MDEKIPDLRSSEERRSDGTFAPGKSPNPGGQAKWLQPIKAELKAGVPGVLVRLMGIIKDGEDKDSIAAGKVWLEYSLPKPKQSIKVSGNGASPLSGLSLEDLLALGRGVKAAEPRQEPKHWKCTGWEAGGPCGFETDNAALYTDHMNEHHSSRALAWTCSCGRFGEGTDKAPPHTRPDGKPCNRAAGEKP